MTISVQKTLPTTSNWYSGSGGDTTITLNGVQRITVNTKKSLIKIKRAKSKKRRTDDLTDEPDNKVIDLKRVEDVIKIKGWLEDDASGGDSAWDKAWMLRAMCACGGPLTNLTIENIQFKSSTKQAFLEDVIFIIPTLGHGEAMNTRIGDGQMARIEVDLTFYIGNER